MVVVKYLVERGEKKTFKGWFQMSKNVFYSTVSLRHHFIPGINFQITSLFNRKHTINESLINRKNSTDPASLCWEFPSFGQRHFICQRWPWPFGECSQMYSLIFYLMMAEQRNENWFYWNSIYWKTFFRLIC